jgi:hypothetical protein
MKTGASRPDPRGDSNHAARLEVVVVGIALLRSALRPPQRLGWQFGKMALVVERKLAEVPEAISDRNVEDPGPIVLALLQMPKLCEPSRP